MKIAIEFDTATDRIEFAWKFRPLVINAEESERFDVHNVPVSRVIDNQYGAADSASPWFAFYVEDCFDPPIWLVRADSWESAYDDFVDALPETDLGDLDEDQRNELESTGDLSGYTYDSSGLLKYTEAVMGYETKIVSVRKGAKS